MSCGKFFTMTDITEKWIVTTILVLWWLLMPQVGCSTEDKSFFPHVLYMVSHGNVWHLAGNLFVIWLFKGSLHLIESLLTGFLMSFVPMIPGLWTLIGSPADMVTMGFSGVIFVIIGIKCGEAFRRWSMAPNGLMMMTKHFCYHVLPFALLGFFIPHLNWSLHLYCLLTGTLLGTMHVPLKKQ